MVYCVAFGCNNNSCSSKNISFFSVFRPTLLNAVTNATVDVQLPVFTAFSANCFVGFSADRRRITGSVPSIFFDARCRRVTKSTCVYLH